MGKAYFLLVAMLLCFMMLACGAPPKQPVTGADLVATAVAARYVVIVDAVEKLGDRYEWTVSAVNGSEYSWRGTLYIKLVGPGSEIVESHDFKIDEMVAPAGKTKGLKFTSDYAPAEEGGDITALKAEVNVVDYKEPTGG